MGYKVRIANPSLARERPQSGHIFLVIFKTVIRRSPTVHITYVMPCFDFPIVSLPESQEHEVWLLTITSYKGHNRRLREYHCDDVTRFYADITSTVGVKKSARKYPRYLLHLSTSLQSAVLSFVVAQKLYHIP